nr:hypothetical protein [Bacteroidales bacterium]
MKKLFTFLMMMLLTLTTLFAQSNDKISYQAVVRNSNNELVVNEAVTVTISVANSEGGAAVYTETHNVTTNANGLMSLLVGTGTVTSGAWSDIDWSSAFVTSSMVVDGETINHTVAVNAVPYALYADQVDPTQVQNAVNDAMATALAPYATTNDLGAAVNDINNHIDDTLADYSTTEDINDTLAYYTPTAQLPAVYDGTLTITVNGTDYVFTANQATNVNVPITIPSDVATTAELEAAIQHLEDSLASYPTNEDLEDTLASYPTNTDLEDTLASYPTNEDLEETLGNYATSERVETFFANICDSIADCIEGYEYATAADLQQLAQQMEDTLASYPTTAKLEDTLASYPTNAELEETLGDYATSEDLLADSTALAGQITDLAERVNTFNTHVCDSIATCLEDYATKEDLLADSTALAGQITALGTAIDNRIKADSLEVLGLYTQAMLKLKTDSAAFINAIHDTANVLRAEMPAAQVQADWEETNTDSKAYILNKPEIPTVNTGTLTIIQGEEELGTFTANSSDDVEIEIPEMSLTAEDLNNFIDSVSLPTALDVYSHVQTMNADIKEGLKTWVAQVVKNNPYYAMNVLTHYIENLTPAQVAQVFT